MPKEDTMTIHGVLLVPTAGDPLGLLREGPCGARPPKEVWNPTIRRGGLMLDNDLAKTARMALVLAWAGSPVAEGVCRLMQRVADTQDPDGEETWHMPRGAPTAELRHVLQGARVAESDGFGTLVLLDAAGLEVVP